MLCVYICVCLCVCVCVWGGGGVGGGGGGGGGWGGLDFSKTFDNVDHEIVLAKLKYYGIRGISSKWFKSYLENLKQFVTYNRVNEIKNTTDKMWCPPRIYIRSSNIIDIHKWSC